MKEVTIQIRPNQISIQAGGIGNDTEAAKEILQNALNALNNPPKSVYHNEIVFEKPKP